MSTIIGAFILSKDTVPDSFLESICGDFSSESLGGHFISYLKLGKGSLMQIMELRKLGEVLVLEHSVEESTWALIHELNVCRWAERDDLWNYLVRGFKYAFVVKLTHCQEFLAEGLGLSDVEIVKLSEFIKESVREVI